MRKIYRDLVRLFDDIRYLFIRRKKVDNKTLAQVMTWCEDNGLDMNSAAQVFGFLKAKGINPAEIRLKNYGIPYSFAEFQEWFDYDPENYAPVPNKFAIFWDDHQSAVVGVFDHVAANGYYVDCIGRKWRNAMIFISMGVYRYILNVPEDMELSKLNLSHLAPSPSETEQAVMSDEDFHLDKDAAKKLDESLESEE